jgi:hypothetical protein
MTESGKKVFVTFSMAAVNALFRNLSTGTSLSLKAACLFNIFIIWKWEAARDKILLFRGSCPMLSLSTSCPLPLAKSCSTKTWSSLT